MWIEHRLVKMDYPRYWKSIFRLSHLSDFPFKSLAFNSKNCKCIFIYRISLIFDDYFCTSRIALIFGVITVLAGFIGVAVGAESSRRLKSVNPRADALLCAFGLLTCVPFLFGALLLSQWYTIPTWVRSRIIDLVRKCNNC